VTIQYLCPAAAGIEDHEESLIPAPLSVINSVIHRRRRRSSEIAPLLLGGIKREWTGCRVDVGRTSIDVGWMSGECWMDVRCRLSRADVGWMLGGCLVNVGWVLSVCRTDVGGLLGPSLADVGCMSGRCQANVGCMSGGRWADVGFTSGGCGADIAQILGWDFGRIVYKFRVTIPEI